MNKLLAKKLKEYALGAMCREIGTALGNIDRIQETLKLNLFNSGITVDINQVKRKALETAQKIIEKELKPRGKHG